MKQKLWIFVFLVLNAFISMNADDSYYPCRSYISFSYDDSNTLNNNNFKTQMNFIKNVVGTLNYPNRLRAEGGYTGEFNWNSGLSIAQMQNNIDNAQENPIPYSLSQQAASLLTSIEVLDNDYNDPIAALIFISDTSDTALKNADRWFAKLSGIRITFVLLGNNVDSLKLRNYANNFIYWPDLALSQPDNWDLLSSTAFGCANEPPTKPTASVFPTTGSTTNMITPATTSSTTSFTGSTQAPFYPCKTWISFGVDDSTKLSANDYYTQIGFIANSIGFLNHPERISVYGMHTVYTEWNSDFSIKSIQAQVLAIDRYSSYSLRAQLSNLVSALLDSNAYDIQITTIIFISDTSTDALAGADQYMSFLTDVQITFVLLGSNVDSSKLTKFSNNFIYWSDLSQSQPDNWDDLFYDAYGCNIITSTKPFTTIQTWTGPSLPTTIAPYIPCKSWISFGVDDSSVSSLTDYYTQIGFIANSIGFLNHPERISVYGMHNVNIYWNNYFSIKSIQAEVLAINQYNSYSLLNQLSNLVSSLSNLNACDTPATTILFISDTSDSSLAGADQYMSYLTNVRITFVLLGSNADSSKLTKYSNNFIYWTDLSQSQPDNWDTSSYAAYGCNGKNKL